MFETNYTAGGRLDAPHYPTFTVPFVVGMKKEVLASATATLEYVVPFVGELYAISFDASMYQNDDNWDLKVDGELICDKIFVKRAPEGVNLMAFIPVVPGTKVTVDFRNIGGDKVVWATLHFLKEGDLSKPLPPQPPGGLSPIKVDKSVIRISLIDDGDEDGDRLSVFLNGACVKYDHLLKHDQAGGGTNGVHYIEMPLAPGDNEIVFQGESAGAVGSALTSKFRISDTQGNVLYQVSELPSLTMAGTGTDGIAGSNRYLDPKPTVRWIINRTT